MTTTFTPTKILSVRLIAGERGVPSLAEASRLVCAEITALDLGSGEWMRTRANIGRLTHGGAVLGHVSYNGRCWDRHGEELLDEETVRAAAQHRDDVRAERGDL